MEHFFGGDVRLLKNLPQTFCYNDRILIRVDMIEIDDHAQGNSEVFLKVVEDRGLVLWIRGMFLLLCIIVSSMTLAMLTLRFYVEKLILEHPLPHRR